MRKLKLFFTMLMLIAFSVGNVWGTSPASITFSEKSLTNAQEYTDPFAIDDKVSVTFGSGGKYYNTGQAMRVYANGTMTISGGEGVTITAISITIGSSSSGSFTASEGTYDNGSWSGSASSITFTRGSGSGHIRVPSIEVTYTTGGSSDPTLSADPVVIDFGTVEQGASVAAKTVAVTYSNLTGSVTYSGLSDVFAATGTISASGDEITITPSTATIGEYEQTLTIQSTADSKSQAVTVTMNVVEPFDGLKLTFDVSSNPGEWPTTNDASLTNYTYALNAVDYTFALKNIKCNSGYLMMTATAVLGLPAIEGYKLEKVEATNSSSCSTTTQVKITSDEAGDEVVSGGAAQTFSTTSTKYTYTLSDTEENTMYYLIATNKNCQLVTLVLYYEEATPSAPKAVKPTFTGDETFLNSTSVSLSTTTEGASIYYTMGDAPADPTTSSTLYEGPINVTATTTIKAIAVKAGMDNSPVAEATFTKATIMTVAEAKAAIDAAGSTPIENQYVTGIISQIDGYDGTHHSITYWISADGTTTDQLEVYSGKGLNGADFAGLSDLSLGDEVIVKGTLKNYKGTDEFDMNSQIIQLNRTIAAPTFTPDGGGFLTTLNVALASATEGAEVRYTVDGSDPISTSTLYENPIELSATTTIKAAAFKDEFVSVIVLRTFTKGTKITVAEALAALDSSSPIENQFVYGKVSTAPTSNPNSGRLTYKISDDGAAVDELEVYNGYGLNGAAFADKTDLQVGDEVTIYGTLKIYNEKKEFDGGNYLLEFNRPVIPTYSITYVENGANEDIEDVAAATNLPNPLPTVTKNEKVFGGWFTTSTFDGGTEAVAGAALSDDVILYAKWNDLSPWASVYTSNVELSGSQNVKVTITVDEEDKNFDGVKMNKAAAATFTIPAGTTNLYAHMAAWNGEAQTVTVSGDCFDADKSIDIVADANISGSGTTYDIDDAKAPTDYFKEIVLDKEVTEPTEITITAASGKRFVLFGVNQVGGLVLESIAISGTATELEYNEGDHFDPAGLKVMGHYSDNSDAEITEGIDWAFDPDPLTEGTTSVSVTATAGGFTSDAFVVNGLTVNGAAPLSPWATVYTSNVELSGSQNVKVTITVDEEDKNFDGVKMNKAAAATFTIPAGTTNLYAHMAAWNGEAQTVTVSGDCFDADKSIDIVADANISGSGTTYDIDDAKAPTDYFKEIVLDKEVTEPTEITITAASGKRFVLFGVNQEGGVLPVLESIEIKGDLTTKTGYKAGDALNLDGLTVEATYSIGGVAQTPVDITDKLGDGLTLTYDPLVENQTEITITATYGDKSDDITITGLDPVASADPKIYVSTLNVNFASVEVGESVPASETVTVTLTNVASVTATLGGTNPEAFSISPASLTESGDITISILANTDAAASYAATLTISDGEGGADDKTVNLSFAVTEPVVEDDVTGTWTLVTDAATLAAGKKVIIAQYVEADGAINTMAGQASNNRSVIASIVAGATLTPTVGTKVMTLADAGEGHFYLKTSDGEYLYNASTSSKSYLRTKAEEENVSWTIAVDAEGVATITSVENTNRTKMRYNPNTSGSPLFNCYASGQEDIALYMLEEDTPEPPVVNYTEVRNGLTAGWYYTMCLDKAVTAVQGATIWRVVSKAENGTDVILEDVDGTLDAGRPYIFFATADKLEVVYTGDAVGSPITEGNNGLVGSFVKAQIAQNPNNYIIYNNELYVVNSNNVYVGDHRAYLNMGGVPDYQNSSAPAPGRRRISMAVHGEQVATGMEGVQPSEISNQKVLINGQLFILRGEKMYDATGRLVK